MDDEVNDSSILSVQAGPKVQCRQAIIDPHDLQSSLIQCQLIALLHLLF